MAKDDEPEGEGPKGMLSFLHDRELLVRRFLLAEVLGRPLSMRYAQGRRRPTEANEATSRGETCPPRRGER